MAAPHPLPPWALSMAEQAMNATEISAVMTSLQHHLPDHKSVMHPAAEILDKISAKLNAIYHFVDSVCNPHPSGPRSSNADWALISSPHLSADACLVLRSLNLTLLTVRTMLGQTRARRFRRPWELMLAQMRGENLSFVDRLSLYHEFIILLESIVIHRDIVDPTEMDALRKQITRFLQIQSPLPAHEWATFVTTPPPAPALGTGPDAFQPPSGAPSPNSPYHRHTPSGGGGHSEAPPGAYPDSPVYSVPASPAQTLHSTFSVFSPPPGTVFPGGGYRSWSRSPIVSYSVPNSPVGFTEEPHPFPLHPGHFPERSRSLSPTVVSFSSGPPFFHTSPPPGSLGLPNARVGTPFYESDTRGRSRHRFNAPCPGLGASGYSDPNRSPSPDLPPNPPPPDPSQPVFHSRHPDKPPQNAPPLPIPVKPHVPIPVPNFQPPPAAQPFPTMPAAQHARPQIPSGYAFVSFSGSHNGVSHKSEGYIPLSCNLPPTASVSAQGFGQPLATPVSAVTVGPSGLVPPGSTMMPPPPPFHPGPGVVLHPLTFNFPPGNLPGTHHFTPSPPVPPGTFPPGPYIPAGQPHFAHPSPDVYNPASGSPRFDPNAGSKHWAAAVLRDLNPAYKFKPGTALSTCYGLDETDISNHLARNQFVEVMNLAFKVESLMIRVYCRQSDNRARVLISYVDNLGRTIKSCHHLTSLQIRRHGSTIELVHYRPGTPHPWTIWAQLCFASYERLVVFATALICLKRQDHHSATLPDPLVQDWMGFEEKSEFGGQIEGPDPGNVQAFQLFRDSLTNGIRVESSVRHGKREGTPLWTGFITRLPRGVPGSHPVTIHQVSATVVDFLGMKPIVFCMDFPIPKIPTKGGPGSREGVRVVFTSRADADTFIQVASRLLN